MTNVNSSPPQFNHTAGCTNVHLKAHSINYRAHTHSDTNLCIHFSTFTFATVDTQEPPGPYYLAMIMPLGIYSFSDVKLSAFYCLLIPLACRTLGGNVTVGF